MLECENPREYDAKGTFRLLCRAREEVTAAGLADRGLSKKSRALSSPA